VNPSGPGDSSHGIESIVFLISSWVKGISRADKSCSYYPNELMSWTIWTARHKVIIEGV
jgi:hypothetical protein